MTDIKQTPDFYTRLLTLAGEVTLAPNFVILVGRDNENPSGRFYFQIRCWRKDVITGEMGYGFGGKAYLSEHATDSELVQTIFGLYKGYYEHEARETFQWRDRRVFGPHISTEALWEVARRVDVRSAKHVEDRHGVPGGVTYSNDVLPTEHVSRSDYQRAMDGATDGGRLG